MKACGGWWVGCKFGGSGGFSVVLGFDFGFYGGSMVVESCRGWWLSLSLSLSQIERGTKKMSRYEK